MLDRATSRGVEELQQEFRIQSVERLVDRLERAGDSRESLVQWLGHPIREIMADEFEALHAYVDQAEEARSKNEPTPFLPPLHG